MQRQDVEERLELLRREQEGLRANMAELQAQIAQMQANLNAYDGAIQDCEWWLKVLEKEQDGEAVGGNSKQE